MNSRFNEDVGARKRAQREYMGLTREGLCSVLAISPQFLSEMKRGVKGASAETLTKLCKGLNISAHYLLMGKGKPPDTGRVGAALSTLDSDNVLLAEEMLKLFMRTVAQNRG